MTKTERLEYFIDGLNLPNFKGKEFTPYWSRMRNGVRNSVPPEALWPNIVRTLVVLQALRTDLGASIGLTSTYRSPAYNTAIAGAGGSYHMHFIAIDFTCVSGRPADWARELIVSRQEIRRAGNEREHTNTTVASACTRASCT